MQAQACFVSMFVHMVYSQTVITNEFVVVGFINEGRNTYVCAYVHYMFVLAVLKTVNAYARASASFILARKKSLGFCT